MLVRRFDEAAVVEWHRLSAHVLMDAGELGSRNLSVTWLEVPPGARQTLHSDAGSEQAYVVVRGAGTMSVAGDTQQVGEGDLILVAANFAIYRYRRSEPVPRLFVGCYRYKLKRTDAGLKIQERRSILDAEELGAMGAVSFLL